MIKYCKAVVEVITFEFEDQKKLVKLKIYERNFIARKVSTTLKDYQMILIAAWNEGNCKKYEWNVLQ
jgi:hypothetical protein